MSKPIDILKKQIKENRPNISNASVLTYSSLLKSIYLTHNETMEDMSVEWFRNTKHIISALENKPAQTRKTAISALIVLLGKSEDIDPEILKMMYKDADEVREKYKGQQMSEKQKDNWINMTEVKDVESRLYTMIKPILSQKHELSPEQKVMITNWLLVALSSGVYFPPRRSEWTYIKLKDYNPETDNYVDLKKGVFVLNRYKTVKLYGRDEVAYGKQFGTLLKKVVSKLPDQTYLLENKGKPFSAPLITMRLNKLFGKNVSTSMLRHIWTSDKYKDMPSLKELSANAEAMGHSVSQHLEYIVRS
jgi:hypothetical protein